MKYCILYEVCMINTAPHSTLSPQMWCIKKKKIKDWFARTQIYWQEFVNLSIAKKFGLICFPRLIYCDQEPLLLLNLTVHLFGCTYKAISTRYKICFTPKSLNFSMGASLLAVAKSIYYLSKNRLTAGNHPYLTSSHVAAVAKVQSAILR